jgi:hypothetical protein
MKGLEMDMKEEGGGDGDDDKWVDGHCGERLTPWLV